VHLLVLFTGNVSIVFTAQRMKIWLGSLNVTLCTVHSMLQPLPAVAFGITSTVMFA